jgi:hypothetical protein
VSCAVVRSWLIDPEVHRYGRGFRVMHDMTPRSVIAQVRRKNRVLNEAEIHLGPHSVFFTLPFITEENSKGLILTIVGL